MNYDLITGEVTFFPGVLEGMLASGMIAAAGAFLVLLAIMIGSGMIYRALLGLLPKKK